MNDDADVNLRKTGFLVPRVSAQNRREQLLEAAIRVMSKEGLDRATTRRIAEVAGTTQGVFHYAFQDKNELLTAVVAAVTTEIETSCAVRLIHSKG